MAEFRMPTLGADMEAGTLVEWKVKAGDRVMRGDVVAVVETDKGAIEVEIWEDGIVEEILVQPKAKVPVGTVLALVRGAGEAEVPRAELRALGRDAHRDEPGRPRCRRRLRRHLPAAGGAGGLRQGAGAPVGGRGARRGAAGRERDALGGPPRERRHPRCLVPRGGGPTSPGPGGAVTSDEIRRAILSILRGIAPEADLRPAIRL